MQCLQSVILFLPSRSCFHEIGVSAPPTSERRLGNLARHPKAGLDQACFGQEPQNGEGTNIQDPHFYNVARGPERKVSSVGAFLAMVVRKG